MKKLKLDVNKPLPGNGLTLFLVGIRGSVVTSQGCTFLI
jgi:hypothetical protein